MKELPALSSLSSLCFFSCAAKHASFTLAADELHITQSAVSHRIRKLEEQLGVKLFQRFTRRLVLTEEGVRLAAVLETSLADIENEIRNIRNQELNGSLNLTAPPSFLGCWLLPRLEQFRIKYPGIRINSQARSDLVDFRAESIDIAVYYGNGVYPGLSVTPLMEEKLIPVCTREYASYHNLWNNPQALNTCMLLHDSTAWPQALYYSEWEEWATKAQVTRLNYEHCYTFDRSDLAVQAAMNGSGVAIGRLKLVRRRLKSGELVTPFDLPCRSEQNYYVVSNKDFKHSARLAAFTDWIKSRPEL